jgi:hypothetical protein
MFYVNDEYGCVQYDQNNKSMQVTHPDSNIVKLVKAYLTRKKFLKYLTEKVWGKERRYKLCQRNPGLL